MSKQSNSLRRSSETDYGIFRLLSWLNVGHVLGALTACSTVAADQTRRDAGALTEESSTNAQANHSDAERTDGATITGSGPSYNGSTSGITAHTTDAALDLDELGPYPYEPSPVTRGGTMSFLNVGASGWWPRRLERKASDPACSYKDGEDTWGGHCCMEEHHTDSVNLSPFDEEMVLILKSLNVKQLAVYQPKRDDAEQWTRVSSWDNRGRQSENLWFTQQGDGSAMFPGDLTSNDCVGYLSQHALLECDVLDDYYCPSDDGIMHQGFTGSKLFVFLASMTFKDADVRACDGDAPGHAGPWVALVASELVRDGARKWNGACNCYSRTGSVGDGCGEMNVFEVVLDDNEFSNREFMSTGVRSYQAGHLGGSVCGPDCDRDRFAQDVEVVDACSQQAYAAAPTLTMGGPTDGCPVWRRPEGDRYFLLLLDERARQIQVAVLHPANLDLSLSPLLPSVPNTVTRTDIDAILALRLPH
jgi:hypothetical protein